MIIEIKREKHNYKGIDFWLLLVGEKGQKYKNKEDINPLLWWVIEPLKKDKKLMEYGFFRNTGERFLWFDTIGMRDNRIKDKYHHCNLVAMQMIETLLGGNFFHRIRLIGREIKAMIICERLIFFKRIKYLWVNGLKNGKQTDGI